MIDAFTLNVGILKVPIEKPIQYLLCWRKKRTSLWEFCLFHLGEQLRLRRACACAQARQSLPCSNIQSKEVYEGWGQNVGFYQQSKAAHMWLNNGSTNMRYLMYVNVLKECLPVIWPLQLSCSKSEISKAADAISIKVACAGHYQVSRSRAILYFTLLGIV